MSDTREHILANLRTRLAAASGVTTCIRSIQSEPEWRTYTQSQMPMVAIIEPESEGYQYLPGHRAMQTITFGIRIGFIAWQWDSTAATSANGLLNSVLNAMHADETNGGYSLETSVTDIPTLTRTHPFYVWDVRAKCTYEQSAAAR